MGLSLSVRSTSEGADVGAGDEDAVRVVDLLDRERAARLFRSMSGN